MPEAKGARAEAEAEDDREEERVQEEGLQAKEGSREQRRVWSRGVGDEGEAGDATKTVGLDSQEPSRRAPPRQLHECTGPWTKIQTHP